MAPEYETLTPRTLRAFLANLPQEAQDKPLHVIVGEEQEFDMTTGTVLFHEGGDLFVH